MKLYYSPGACSLASHIVLEEAGANAEYEKVDLRSKQTETGKNFKELNPKGYVPALQLDDGSVLTENMAVLPYLADHTGKMLPSDGMRRWRTLEATAYISSELHKNFKPLFDPTSSDDAKQKAKDTIAQRLELQAGWFGDGPFVMGDELTIADAYLFVILLWSNKMGVTVPENLKNYTARLRERPAVQRALETEGLA